MKYTEHQIWEIGKRVQKYMNEHYSSGIERKILTRKVKYYNNFCKSSRVHPNVKELDGYYAKWILKFSDKQFITPADIDDNAIDEYINNYFNVKKNQQTSPKIQNQTSQEDDIQEFTDILDAYYKY